MKVLENLSIGLIFVGLAIFLGFTVCTGPDKPQDLRALLGLILMGLGFIVFLWAYSATSAKESREATEQSREATKKRDAWLEQWDLLREGMTEAEVRSIIGAPSKIDPLIAVTGEMGAQWTYGSWPFKGIVRFHMGRLVGLQKPR